MGTEILPSFNQIATDIAGKNFSPPLATKEQVKRVATKVIDKLISNPVLAGSKIQQLEDLFENFIIRSFKAKQESIEKSMLSILSNVPYFGKRQELEEELQQVNQKISQITTELNRIKNTYQNDVEKLEALKKYLKAILEDQEIKELILEEIWKEYYAAQENNIWVRSWINSIDRELQEDSCFRAQFGQAQANELERVGMVLFAMMFTFIDRSSYQLSNGERRLEEVPDSIFNVESSHKGQKVDSYSKLREAVTGNRYTPQGIS